MLETYSRDPFVITEKLVGIALTLPDICNDRQSDHEKMTLESSVNTINAMVRQGSAFSADIFCNTYAERQSSENEMNNWFSSLAKIMIWYEEPTPVMRDMEEKSKQVLNYVVKEKLKKGLLITKRHNSSLLANSVVQRLTYLSETSK